MPDGDPAARTAWTSGFRASARHGESFLGCVAPASLTVGVASVALDAVLRSRWAGVGVVGHIGASALLMLAVCLLAGVVCALLLDLVHVLPVQEPRRASAIRALLVGAVAAAVLLPTARWMFEGAWISEHPFAKYGPAVVSCLALGAAVIAYWAVVHAVRSQSAGRWWVARLWAFVFLGGVALGVYVDMHFYVALYTRIHTAIEATCFLLATAAATLLLREWARRAAGAGRVLRRATLSGSALALVTLLSSTLQGLLESRLDHVWRERIYVGRQLDRLRLARAFLRSPSEYAGALAVAKDELEARYDLTTTELDPKWTTVPLAAKSAVDCTTCNVIVFYVDTLRQDVASNAALMPNFHQFASSNLNFTRAYATGSDTLNSVPGLTGGRYDFAEPHAGDLLETAKRLGMKSVVAIPKSANEFLGKLLPRFRFDQTLEVPDFAPGDAVWGYGGNRPSAGQLVDETLAWIEQHPNQRFLSWVFNFELHNWREMDEDHVLTTAARANLAANPDERRWRYEALAGEIDRQFGRLLEAMERFGLSENTIVLFVSDHGESLGEWDFWAHGVVVWESLLRVPLAMRIPGHAALTEDRPVSLADVPATIVPMLSEKPPKARYHGVDLLRFAKRQQERTLPIMFVGQRKETLVRIGVLDLLSDYKLVLPLEVGRPELYDVSQPHPDDEDVAKRDPVKVANLLNLVVRSPMYPRPAKGPEVAGIDP